ncbi:MAG: DUF2306 domain-containing protein [Maribacter sp.]
METLKDLHIINNWIGLVHTLFSIVAMLLGGIVVLSKKGTQKHRIFGYVYVVSMFLLNGTAFGIYNFGRLSMFHFFALISLITVILGIVPKKKRKENWLKKHFTFMSWSVVGLYCAFWAEIGVRFFDMKYFWWVVMLATIGTSIIGAFIINRERKKLNF